MVDIKRGCALFFYADDINEEARCFETNSIILSLFQRSFIICDKFQDISTELDTGINFAQRYGSKIPITINQTKVSLPFSHCPIVF